MPETRDELERRLRYADRLLEYFMRWRHPVQFDTSDIDAGWDRLAEALVHKGAGFRQGWDAALAAVQAGADPEDLRALADAGSRPTVELPAATLAALVETSRRGK